MTRTLTPDEAIEADDLFRDGFNTKEIAKMLSEQYHRPITEADIYNHRARAERVVVALRSKVAG